ncbi:flagellar export protein FliJ [Vulcaniibacterium tengchongense]|uniref:Flagellar FliJ protein n=1 Tax=Vulcaniibacterium tengchongense TaxID=1273429 RepID=A0A3N4W465_9GAMM|nr:flagellar export protein FliJ [Vulcaniibacterium tengchongense]RPE80860.1 flagellar FliJ protein [Vulcaniibacterium tengchongense]
MTRSQRLDPLLRVAQQRQDDAAREVAERDRALAEQEARLDALRRYAEEYAAPPSGGTIAPALLANRLAFRAKLETAVEQQSRIVDNSRRHRDVERARLLLASRDTKVLEQLAGSYRAQETRVAEQRVQRELDDLGARRVRADQEEPR